MTVNAAEITKDNPVSVGIGEGDMSIATKDDGLEYYIDLPLAVKGENIKSVTYSVDKDAIAVHCRKDNNPVIDGDVVRSNVSRTTKKRLTRQWRMTIKVTLKNTRQRKY